MLTRTRNFFVGTPRRAFFSVIFSGMMLVSTPAMAEGAAQAMQILLWLKTQFWDGMVKSAERQVRRQVDQRIKEYTNDLELAFMPTLFCEDDLKQQETIKNANREEQRTHNQQAAAWMGAVGGGKKVYDKAGKPTGDRSVAPYVVAADLNTTTSAMAGKNSSCRPLDGLAADKEGKACTAEEAQLRGRIAIGADVLPPLDQQQTKTEAGAIYTALRDRQNLIKLTAATAVADVDSPTRQALVNNLRTITKKIDVAQLAEQSAGGGVDRDMLVINQVRTLLQIEIYIEDLEIKRLQAMKTGLASEANGERLAALRKRAGG